MPDSIHRLGHDRAAFPASHLLVIVGCPIVEADLREKMRCTADMPIRCEHAEDVDAACVALGRRGFDLVVLATLGRDPRELLERLFRARRDARVIVVAEARDDVLRALDAGAYVAFERARVPPGILTQLLDVAHEGGRFATRELELAGGG